MAGWTGLRRRPSTHPQPRSGKTPWTTSAVSRVLQPWGVASWASSGGRLHDDCSHALLSYVAYCAAEALPGCLLLGAVCLVAPRTAEPAALFQSVVVCCDCLAGIASEAGEYGLCIVRAPVAPSVPGGMVSSASAALVRYLLAGFPASIRLAACSCRWRSCLLPLLRAPAAHHSHRPALPSLMNNSRQVLQLSDPGFKFGTRQQALRDKPWKDWQGVTFQPVRRGWLGCVGSAPLQGDLLQAGLTSLDMRPLCGNNWAAGSST